MSRILLIEDHPYNRLLLTRVLEKKGGFSVIIGEDFNQILNACQTNQVDLVLLDISLDNMYHKGHWVDGVEICKAIKSKPNNVPVILLSAHAVPKDKNDFLKNCGAQDYITKPILDYDEFINSMERALKET